MDVRETTEPQTTSVRAWKGRDLPLETTVTRSALMKAAGLIGGSELIRAPRIRTVQLCGREVVLAEDTRHTKVKAFKQRGGLAAVLEAWMAGATEVVAASTGNHGQAVAAAAASCGLRARVFAPSGTPDFKVKAMAELGAVVVLSDSPSYDVAAAQAVVFATGARLPFIHPFDDVRVIAGQATLMDALVRELGEEPGTVFVPVGGGGLAAGLVRNNQLFLDGAVRLVGVEPCRRPSLTVSLLAGQLAPVRFAQTLAQGANVGQVGSLTYPILRSGLHAMLSVSENDIASAMRTLAALGVPSEGAGALPLAALLGGNAHLAHPDRPLVALVSGASIDRADQLVPQIPQEY